MSLTLNDLKDEILVELAPLVIDGEGLESFAAQVDPAVLSFGGTSRFATLFNLVANDPKTMGIIAKILAISIYKEHLKGKLEITLQVVE